MNKKEEEKAARRAALRAALSGMMVEGEAVIALDYVKHEVCDLRRSLIRRA